MLLLLQNLVLSKRHKGIISMYYRMKLSGIQESFRPAAWDCKIMVFDLSLIRLIEVSRPLVGVRIFLWIVFQSLAASYRKVLDLSVRIALKLVDRLESVMQSYKV